MSEPSPLGAYSSRRGPLHALLPGAKLLMLFVFAVLAVALRGPGWTTLWLGIAAALIGLAGMGWRDFVRVARSFGIVAVLLFVFTAASAAISEAGGWGSFPPADAWAAGALRGYGVVGSLFALILAASAVTASTAIEDMTDTVTWAIGPLRRFGAQPERVALAFSLVIRAIPTTIGIARETRDAARARGLERSPRARVVPLVIRTVAQAHATGEALAARGIGDDEAAGRD
ncbi:energy-coupling factor transporter transmembrane component T family protein [Leucobacter sp. USHLN153]|uniref:energy-coupling factor transporter transmembrane component T family protein n=1 Tax=Leucobacter sp. USHLN153 TaxID=3081268 RepID=UPI003017B5D7